jgi:hypothetical protein
MIHLLQECTCHSAIFGCGTRRTSAAGSYAGRNAGSQRELEEQDPGALTEAMLDVGSVSLDVEDAEVVREIVLPAGSGH